VQSQSIYLNQFALEYECPPMLTNNDSSAFVPKSLQYSVLALQEEDTDFIQMDQFELHKFSKQSKPNNASIAFDIYFKKAFSSVPIVQIFQNGVRLNMAGDNVSDWEGLQIQFNPEIQNVTESGFSIVLQESDYYIFSVYYGSYIACSSQGSKFCA